VESLSHRVFIRPEAPCHGLITMAARASLSRNALPLSMGTPSN
jgi:hypothetical protein